jgi:hypothetical protein
MPEVFHANPIKNDPNPCNNSSSKDGQTTIIPAHSQCFIPFNHLPSVYSKEAHTTRSLSTRIDFKLHSQTRQTPPIPKMNTIHEIPSKKYPHQTVSRNRLCFRIRTRFHWSLSKSEFELILESGDLSLRSSEEEFGNVVVIGGGEAGEEGAVEDGTVDERCSRERE